MKVKPDFSLIKYEKLHKDVYLVMCETKDELNKKYIVYITDGKEKTINPFISKNKEDVEKQYSIIVNSNHFLKN